MSRSFLLRLAVALCASLLAFVPTCTRHVAAIKDSAFSWLPECKADDGGPSVTLTVDADEHG